MQTKSLIEAKIVNVYNLNGITYRKSIVIFLSTRTIFFYPVNGNLFLVRNRKYSIRRLLRCAKRGCYINIRTEAEFISSDYETVYLKKEDLKDMLSDVHNKEELIEEIYEINTRKCG